MNSKAYEKLPGIALDEPDVYETNEQVVNVEEPVYEDDSVNVQTIVVSQKDAFNAFNKTDRLTSRYTDFSDTINTHSKTGYLIDKDTYEHDYLHESLFERFSRLQKELYDFKSEIRQIETDVLKPDDDSDTQQRKTRKIEEAKQLSKQLEHITRDVSDLQLEIAGAKVDPSKLDGKVKKQMLIECLNDSKKSLETSEKTPKATGQVNDKSGETQANDGSITFKLFSDTSETELSKLTKVSDINQRIAKLESIIGTSQQNKVLMTLCANIDNKSLFGLVENLENKINLVDQQSLELIESKISWILQKMQQLNEKKVLIEENEKITKINELFQITSKWNDALATLPNIASRLTSLNDLHQQAIQFSSALTRVDCEQQAIKQTLESNRELLKQLNVKLNENVDSINKSLDNLNSQISSIN